MHLGRRMTAGGTRLDEIWGYCQLGMVRDALASVREALGRKRLDPATFSSATACLIRLERRSKGWVAALVAAYRGLNRANRRKARWDMLCYAHYAGRFDLVLELAPARFAEETNPVELFMVASAATELGELDVLRRLRRRLAIGARDALDPDMQRWLSELYWTAVKL